MTVDPLLTLALVVWFGLWLLRDHRRLGVRRGGGRRRPGASAASARSREQEVA